MALEFITFEPGNTGRGGGDSLIISEKEKVLLISRRAIIIHYSGLKVNNVLIGTARVFFLQTNM